MSRPRLYVVRLSAADRIALEEITRKGTHGAREIARARALLLLDEGESGGPAWSLGEVSEALSLTTRMLLRLRKVACETTALNAVVHKTPVHAKPKTLDGKGEARLIALACSKPPKGHATWTLRLLAAKLVELEIVPTIAHETVRRVLKKTSSGPI